MMFNKYKFVKVNDEVMGIIGDSSEVYVLIRGNSEVLIDATYRSTSLGDHVQHMLNTRVSKWRLSSSPAGEVLTVYAEARTRLGIVEQLKEKWPEICL